MTVMSETPMSAREYFLQMTDPTNWHEGAGPEWAQAMEYVHEGVMEFWDELEENHGSPMTLRIEELERWKAEQLEVEQSWDPQAVGKLLGMTLGTPIYKNIQPAIEKLLARLATERALADRLAHTLDDLVWDYNLGPHTGANNSLAAWKEARSE